MDAKSFDISPANLKATSAAADIACGFLNCADWPHSWNGERWASDMCLSLKYNDRSKALDVAKILRRHMGVNGPTPDRCLLAWIKGMGINPELAS